MRLDVSYSQIIDDIYIKCFNHYTSKGDFNCTLILEDIKKQDLYSDEDVFNIEQNISWSLTVLTKLRLINQRLKRGYTKYSRLPVTEGHIHFPNYSLKFIKLPKFLRLLVFYIFLNKTIFSIPIVIISIIRFIVNLSEGISFLSCMSDILYMICIIIALSLCYILFNDLKK